MTLHMKAALLVAAVVLVTGAGSGLLVNRVMEEALDEEVLGRGAIVAQSIGEHVLPDVIAGDRVAIRAYLQDLCGQMEGLRYAFVTDPDGWVLAHSFPRGFPRALFRRDDAGDERERCSIAHWRIEGSPVSEVGRPMIAGMRMHAYVGMDERLMDDHRDAMRRSIAIVTLLTAGAGIVIGLLFAQRLAGPLQGLAARLRAFGEGREESPAGIAGGPEVTALAHAFGEMVAARHHAEDAKNRAEEALREGEKLRLIGQLAGGIAHEINNRLAAILGNAELLLDRQPAPEVRLHAEAILQAARRSADFVTRVVAFARKGKYRNEPVDLHRVVLVVTELLRHAVEGGLEIRHRLEAASFAVPGDPGQVQNAVLNLAWNAREAMPHGGVLEFATEVAEPGEEVRARLGLEPRPYVRLRVSDTGVGMSEQVMKRLFEPFFTTKEVGKGTGMGLASVYGTVRNHKGAIEVASRPGQGSTFTVWLPLHAGGRTDAAAGPPPGRGEAGSGRRDSDATGSAARG